MSEPTPVVATDPTQTPVVVEPTPVAVVPNPTPVAVVPNPTPVVEPTQDIELTEGETLHINVHAAPSVVPVPTVDLTQPSELVYDGPSDFLTIPMTIAKGASFAYTPVFAEWVKQLQDANHSFHVATIAQTSKA